MNKMIINERPMVSVILITYNQKKYVKKAIESVLIQKVNFDIEILIGDDASIDGTQEILREYKSKDSRIYLYLNNENQGATKNAYNLIMQAKGKYIASLEGDDYWSDEDKLQQQVDFLENNVEFVGCTHNFTIIDESDKPVKNQNLNWIKKKKVFTIDDFKGIYLPGQQSTLLRRNLIFDKLVNLEEVIKIHPMIGDRTTMMLFLMHGNFGFLNKNMSCYRRSTAKTSITDFIYNKSFSSIHTDYIITNGLEKLKQENNINTNFDELWSQLFAKAFILLCYTRDVRIWCLVRNIFLRLDYKSFYYIPCFIIKKISSIIF